MEWVNGNVSNEIELVMGISTIKSWILQVSQKQKEYDINFYSLTTNSFMWIHRDHHVYLDPIDDHLPERSLGNVLSIPEP
jgi:hypothetical protein